MIRQSKRRPGQRASRQPSTLLGETSIAFANSNDSKKRTLLANTNKPTKKSATIATLSVPNENNVILGFVRLDVGSTGTKTQISVAVPADLAPSLQSILDESQKPAVSLRLLTTHSKRIQNNGSFLQIVERWALDDKLPNCALLQNTNLRKGPQDFGVVGQCMPTLVRSMNSYNTEYWKAKTDGEVLADFHQRLNQFPDIQICNIPRPNRHSNVDWNSQVIIYRSKDFIRGNSAKISEIKGGNFKTAYGRPICNHPGGCTRESVKKGRCNTHLPKVSVYNINHHSFSLT